MSDHPAADLEALLTAALPVGHPVLGAISAQGLLNFIAPPFPEDDPYPVRIHLVPHGEGASYLLQVHTPDRPFLMDVITGFLARQHLGISGMVHRVVKVVRGEEGVAVEPGPQVEGGRGEFVLAAVLHQEQQEVLEIEVTICDLSATLKAVAAAVDDHGAMEHLLLHLSRSWGRKEVRWSRFARWLVDGNYVFMGARRYRWNGRQWVPGKGKEDALGGFTPALPEGTLERVYPGVLALLTEYLAKWWPVRTAPMLLDFTRAASAANYIDGWIDPILLADPDGQSCWLLLGRLARAATVTRPSGIPLLAERMNRVLQNVGERGETYRGRTLRALFNHMPLRELLYSSAEDIQPLLEAAIALTGDVDLRLHLRRGGCCDYVALTLFIPRGRYSAALERRLQSRVEHAFGLKVVRTQSALADTFAALTCFMPGPIDTALREVDLERLRLSMIEAVKTWGDRFKEAIFERFPRRQALPLLMRYLNAFPESFQARVPPGQAVEGLAGIEDFLIDGFPQVLLGQGAGTVWALSAILPERRPLGEVIAAIGRVGLTVQEEIFTRLEIEGRTVCVWRFELVDDPALASLEANGATVASVLTEVLAGRMMDDPLNALALNGGLTPRCLVRLRGLLRLVAQLNPAIGPLFSTAILTGDPALARAVLDGLAARFDPAHLDEQGWEEAKSRFNEALGRIRLLREDRAMRALWQVLELVVRTDAFHPEAGEGVAFKCLGGDLPTPFSPHPWKLVFVHDQRMDAVHLRGGPVARGGLRWSDRGDFYVEVLGLMATQMVKNAIIVPVGAKGGFYLHGGQKGAKQVREAYRRFVAALLRLSDNRIGEEIVPPEGIVRRDDDDPYLVVAADKGTATFSDLANEVALERGFWLGDAFASGGSHGYDHKEIGITARGAWESVRHLFRLIGLDPQADTLTVVGIGSPAGDVFGNGMLLSRSLKLIGAFTGKTIFIDPDPDPERSWLERRRLFETCQSWEAYDTHQISPGGGIFDRSAKAIDLPEPFARFLGIETQISGEALIQALLQAPVDLLYNGGIGTYIKAAAEPHEAVMDKVNDPVRVNAEQVRASVLVEGGNLGLTMRARIVLDRQGVLLNTDALDNSGGVNMSDHEVNLKILAMDLLQRGIWRNVEERNIRLKSWEGEVAAQVLDDNAQMVRAITLDGRRSRAKRRFWRGSLARWFEQGVLEEGEEGISEGAVGAWLEEERGIPRPLLAVLLGKLIHHTAEILGRNREWIDRASQQPLLLDYFPKEVVRLYPEAVERHPLGWEITATVVAKRIHFNGGARALERIQRGTDLSLPDAVRAWLVAEALLPIHDYRAALNALEGQVSPGLWLEARMRGEDGVVHVAAALARIGDPLRIQFDLAHHYRQVVSDYFDTLFERLVALGRSDLRAECDDLVAAGIPEAVACHAVCWPDMERVGRIILIKEDVHLPFGDVAGLWLHLHARFAMDDLQRWVDALQARDSWGEQARERLLLRLERLPARLLVKVLGFKRSHESIEHALDAFLEEHRPLIKQFDINLTAFRSDEGKVGILGLELLVEDLEGLVERSQDVHELGR